MNKIKDLSASLVTVHCVAHSINHNMVDCMKDQKGVPYLVMYEQTINSTFWFHQGSSNCTASMRGMEEIFVVPQLKLQVLK